MIQIGRSRAPPAFAELIVESIRVAQVGPYGWIVQPLTRSARFGTAFSMFVIQDGWLTALSPIASRPTFLLAARDRDGGVLRALRVACARAA